MRALYHQPKVETNSHYKYASTADQIPINHPLGDLREGQNLTTNNNQIFMFSEA